MLNLNHQHRIMQIEYEIRLIEKDQNQRAKTIVQKSKDQNLYIENTFKNKLVLCPGVFLM